MTPDRPPKAPMTPREWVFVVDVLGRPVTANAERRMHHYEQHRQRQAWKDAACVVIRAAKVPTMPAVALTVRPRYAKGNLPDVDAIAPSVKAVIDALVAEGVIADDSPAFVPSLTYQAGFIERGAPDALIVKVEAL
jgi:Holliday junction resolvase RusA-like endonuclease